MTAQDIIKANKAQFLSEMSAKDIASTLKLYDLIPDEVEYDITHAKSRGEANGRLLTFLMGQASEEQAQGIFKFASEKKDFGRMSQFATSILQQLQQGHFVVLLYYYICMSVNVWIQGMQAQMYCTRGSAWSLSLYLCVC